MGNGEFFRYLRANFKSERDINILFRGLLEKGDVGKARIAKAYADSTFPKESQKARRGAPTIALFQKECSDFPSIKSAYIWVLNRFAAGDRERTNNKIFVDGGVAQMAFFHGKGRKHFAKSKDELFEHSSHLAENPANYSRLDNRWYANVNCDHKQMTNRIIELCVFVGMKYGEEEDVFLWFVKH